MAEVYVQFFCFFFFLKGRLYMFFFNVFIRNMLHVETADEKSIDEHSRFVYIL